jgi:hypothetical protein
MGHSVVPLILDELRLEPSLLLIALHNWRDALYICESERPQGDDKCLDFVGRTEGTLSEGNPFPKLSAYTATSPATAGYNCIAWAFGDKTR